MADYDIAIVGAGIAGSALAAALSDSHYRVALLEARELPDVPDSSHYDVTGFDPRVSAITPASQAFLQRIDAWSGVTEHRLAGYHGMQVWDGEGTGAIEFSATEAGVPLLGHIIENRVLTHALIERVQEAGVADVRASQPVEDVLRNEAGDIVGLRLAEGKELKASLVVAADGALSRLRDMGEFKTREWDYGHHALALTVETELSHADVAYQRFMSTGPLAFLPLPGENDRHFCSIVWSINSDRVEEILALEQPEFLQRLEEAFESRLGKVLAASQPIAFPLRQRHAVEYVQPGLALIGDAAHTIHPLAGQGINLGLQDVIALADELLHSRGLLPGDIRLLQRYQRQRKGDNLIMAAAMDGFKTLFGREELPLRLLRGVGMRLADQAGPIKQQIMRRAMGL